MMSTLEVKNKPVHNNARSHWQCVAHCKHSINISSNLNGGASFFIYNPLCEVCTYSVLLWNNICFHSYCFESIKNGSPSSFSKSFLCRAANVLPCLAPSMPQCIIVYAACVSHLLRLLTPVCFLLHFLVTDSLGCPNSTNTFYHPCPKIFRN